MARFYRRFTISSLLLFTAVMLVIHAQPYDNHDLHALLMPDNCAMPCFMGIRPGVTTFRQAIVILESHHWVGDIQIFDYDPTHSADKIVEWGWNGSEPPFLQTTWTNQPTWMRTQDGIVVEMEIATNFRLADIFIRLGRPVRGGFDLISNTTSLSNNVYPPLGFRVSGTISCPITLDRLWNSPQTLVFFSGYNMGLHDPTYPSQFLQIFRDEYTACWKH